MTDRDLGPAAIATDGPGLGSRARGWIRAFVGSPTYPADAADRREFE
jgi:hypothetical protein